MLKIPLDAIPDLSDVQVIIFTEYPGQAPQVVEDQVTYPLTTAMLAVPFAKVVRGYSFFGLSFVYIIFEDGTDMYWARSRVLEYLNFVSGRLPEGVNPALGPDATSISWRATGMTCRSCAPSRTGICVTSSPPYPGWPRWPPSAALSSSTR
jgi:Cu(I)/Ag(I) efflux system membrane protein CusA/SilA